MKTFIGWVSFAGVQLAAAAAFPIGVVLLFPFAGLSAWTTRESRYILGRTITVWRGGWLTWIWGNEEDGVTGAPFYQAQFKDIRVCAYLWSAWRNSANNLRFVFKWVGGPFYRWENATHTFYVQAGWYPNGFPVLSAGAM